MKIIIEAGPGEAAKAMASVVFHKMAEIPSSGVVCNVVVDMDRDDSAVKIKVEEDAPFNYATHLIMDPKDGPTVKGTWVTVAEVISYIVDGNTWSDILKSHPELCEDDIRACLNYHLQEHDEDFTDVNRQETCRDQGHEDGEEVDCDNSYVRDGCPHPGCGRPKGFLCGCPTCPAKA